MTIYQSATVISDIHGMSTALEAVLEAEANDPSDVLIVAGDTAAGPQPNQVIDLLMQHTDRLLVISGNGDREILEYLDGTFRASANPMLEQEARQITDRNVEWLRALPKTLELDLAGFGRVHVCHATPQNDMDIALVDSRLSRWNEVFADLAEDVSTVILGHTHMPFQRLVDRRRVINPGSIGMPFGGAGAHWVRLRADGVIETHVTPVDVDNALASLAATSSDPAVVESARPYLVGEISDRDAIEKFGPKDGR
ncbi:MAG: metallophosphoesterase family protein [Thermomicrobiales bacterium]